VKQKKSSASYGAPAEEAVGFFNHSSPQQYAGDSSLEAPSIVVFSGWVDEKFKQALEF
jgi:hypothetical protein